MNFTAQKPAQLLLTADAKHDLSYLKFCPTFIATVKSQSVPLCRDFSSDRRFSSRELETFISIPSQQQNISQTIQILS